MSTDKYVLDKHAIRKLRKIVGPEVADIVGLQEQRIRFANSVLRRNIVGRLKWLLFGK
jgi:hypothetical protein